MVLYHDNEYKEDGADVEVAIPITGRVSLDPKFEVKTWEPHSVVSLIHKGPYQRVGEAWGRMGRHLAENSVRVIAPMRELYLNDPANTPESELLTELQAPIE
jgi:effector-binding domain-containing protein